MACCITRNRCCCLLISFGFGFGGLGCFGLGLELNCVAGFSVEPLLEVTAIDSAAKIEDEVNAASSAIGSSLLKRKRFMTISFLCDGRWRPGIEGMMPGCR
ncbi:MAG TPA: hypothetical protein VJ302_16055 [Blastocatellia bacterium]|nr:hypothetical protein [Blastocatellia bacterium]